MRDDQNPRPRSRPRSSQRPAPPGRPRTARDRAAQSPNSRKQGGEFFARLAAVADLAGKGKEIFAETERALDTARKIGVHVQQLYGMVRDLVAEVRSSAAPDSGATDR
ncbi:hypothetical protein [Streptomyces sp. NPDC051921]|uniref:hypothetical protein n=1 Tax=Streptomyces sp. NPDC051921 TaxID=3155806 RepID=UPI003434C034